MRWLLVALLPVISAARQIPLGLDNSYDPATTSPKMYWRNDDFAFKTGKDILTPQDLIELPRPGAGIANTAGDLVIVPVSTYSFKDKRDSKSVWIAPLESTELPLEIPLPNGGDTFWLDDRTLGHVMVGQKGKEYGLYVISIKFETQLRVESPVLVGTFPRGPSPANFKYSRGASKLVFSAYVYPDIDLRTVMEQDEAYENRGYEALVYEDTYERHWDAWAGPKRPKLFAVNLTKGSDGKWMLGDDFVAPMKGMKHDVPVEPFGGTNDFDVSDTHIVYTTKDPKLPAAWHTKQDIFLVDLLGESEPCELTLGVQGATHNPVFSVDGTKIAWTELRQDGYESDRARIVIYDLVTKTRYMPVAEQWDRSADTLVFSPDGSALYFTAGEEAHIKLFKVTLPTTSEIHPEDGTWPVALTDEHAAQAPQPLSNGRVLFTQSSFTSPNDVFLLCETESAGGHVRRITDFSSKHLRGKDLDKGESFWFEGANNIKVQGWAHRPKGWREGVEKAFPVVVLIHGGPQGAWEDQWSIRWNPNVFAQQGYFVVSVNPTGSTSFGQEFTDAITEDWGGRPFEDLRKGWNYVLEKYPEIDADRAAAAGASWGGYAINWIQGHPEYGFGFKAFVCHDGVFDPRYNGYSTDELFFFQHDFGGPPWDPKTKLVIEKFNPSNYVANFSTPQLIIHGSKDFRIPETDGISVFHALQQRGIPSRLVIFPGENHWVLKHENSLKWHYEVFRWLDKYIGEKSLKGNAKRAFMF